MNVSLKQLSVFVSIAKLKTVTAAAEALFLSKAAVSISLSDLESQINHSLFDRVKNRLVLNQEGVKLLPLADELLIRAKNIPLIYGEDMSLHGQLSIGASDTIGNQITPKLLSQFRVKYQHKSQQLLIANTKSICQKLINFEIDIGLTEGSTQLASLVKIPWVSDEMCVICSTQSALASKKNISWKSLTNSEWLLREEGSGSREFFIKNIAPEIIDWQEAFELNSTEAIINSVSAGIGLACLSRLSAEHALVEGRVAELKINLVMSRQFWLLIHQDKYQSPLLKTFIDFCLQMKDVNSAKLN